MEKREKIRSFKDLLVWQEAHKLVVMIYKTTGCFPRDEQFGIINQMRRAVVSVSSNIAEGFSRNSYKEKHQFYSQSSGSLTELYDQLLVSRDVSYLSDVKFKEVKEKIISVQKLLNRLLAKTKTFFKTR